MYQVRAQEPVTDAPGPDISSRRLVVVAEDDDDLRWCLIDALSKLDVRVVELEDSFELDDFFRFAERLGLPKGLPDVVVTDVRMPGGSGLDALRRARAEGVRCPFVVLTGFPGAEMEALVASLGDAVLVGKPAPMPLVVKTVSELLPQVR